MPGLPSPFLRCTSSPRHLNCGAEPAVTHVTLCNRLRNLSAARGEVNAARESQRVRNGPLEREGKTRRLVDGAFRVELARDVGATDQQERNAGVFQRHR